MKKVILGIVMAAVLVVGANTIFPPANGAQVAATDPFDPMVATIQSA